MKRRQMLAAAATAGVAGCITRGSSDDSDGDEGSGSDADGSKSGSSVIADRTIETTARKCASGDPGDASMTVDGADVVIDGALSASTPCHDAVLAEAAVEGAQLRIRVSLEERGGICTECVGRIAYRAEIAVSAPADIDSVQLLHADGSAYTFTVE